jgi:hypothetical protein
MQDSRCGMQDVGDKIANYTSIVGRLRLEVDSLEDREPVRIDSFFTYSTPEKRLSIYP